MTGTTTIPDHDLPPPSSPPAAEDDDVAEDKDQVPTEIITKSPPVDNDHRHTIGGKRYSIVSVE